MNTFKRKALFTAVIAGLGVAAGTAEAVYLNPNKTGQVLIYPYYTVQSTNGNSWNTYLSIVNTTTRAKAVKVRFIEGKTSAEVLDFNLFLSPNDMWTGAIVPADATSGSPGHLVTADVSCTNPAIPSGGVDFRNYQYLSGDDSLPGTGLDRTREGYVEMIEMGTLTGAWATAVTHTSAGVPANCAVVQNNNTPSSIESPQGGLVGTGTLINVNAGRDVGYKAEALEAWRTTSDYTIPSATTPNLGDATPTVSVVLNAGQIDAGATPSSSQITAYRTTFAGSSGASAGAQAVASVFMHSSVINEYILDSATASNTDWVVTQPLKRAFVTSLVAASPYSNVLTSNGACETIGFTYFNREERTQTASGTDFSPLPPAAPANSMCWESNVLAIRNSAPASGATSAVLGSMNVTNVTVNSAFQNGWGRLSFGGVSATTTGLAGTADVANLGMDVLGATVTPAVPVTFLGLPVAGFMIRTFDNGTLTCSSGACQGNYSALFPHSYDTTVTP